MTKSALVSSLLVVLIFLVCATSLNQGLCTQGDPDNTGNFVSLYKIEIQNGFYVTERDLYVSFPSSVIGYYQAKSHLVNGERDFAKFVTPGAVLSIAKSLRNMTKEMPYCDEEFANAVLTFVRKIPYVRSNAKYPVETLFSDRADCDGLSILAASIMKAGGLEVVLLYYGGINPTHMNIGVFLEQTPVARSWWASPKGFEYGNKTYWVAECTALADWTVGDRPELLADIEPLVIPLTKCEEKAPIQVSSSLDNPLNSSAVSINLEAVYSETNNERRFVNVSGSIFPKLPNQTVLLYVNQPGYAPTVYPLFTDESGNYFDLWNVTLPGTYVLRASWCGSLNYSGSDTEAVTVFIGAQKPVAVTNSGESLVSEISEIQYEQYFPLNLAMMNRAPKEFLKNNTVGEDIVLSGDFKVLSDGHEISLEDSTITIPAHPQTYRAPRSRQYVTVIVPEREIPIPGVEQLNSHFGFIMTRNVENNYTASVRLLNSNDLSEIAQNLDESRAVVINASNVAAKQDWCRVQAVVSEQFVSVEICDSNGTTLDMVNKTRENENIGLLGVLVMYQTGQIVAFKNLSVEAASHDDLLVSRNEILEVTENNVDFLYPQVRTSMFLAGAVLAFVSIWQRRRKPVPLCRSSLVWSVPCLIPNDAENSFALIYFEFFCGGG